MLKLTPLNRNLDDTVNLTFNYDEEFIEYYKEQTGVQVVDDREVGAFIEKMIKGAVGEL